MKKKTYIEPQYRIVYLSTLCDGGLMEGSAQKTGDEEVDDDDDFLGTRPFDFDWQ